MLFTTDPYHVPIFCEVIKWICHFVTHAVYCSIALRLSSSAFKSAIFKLIFKKTESAPELNNYHISLIIIYQNWHILN